MTDWRTCRLGDVLTLKRGYDLPKQRRAPGPVPIVSSSGITDHHAEAMVRGPGVVTGRYGTLGKVFYLQEDFWPLNTALYVSNFKGNVPRFVSLLLETVDFFAHSDKAAVPGVNRNHLHDAKVRIPDVQTQEQIANLFAVLDDKIVLNRRMNETLEAMARAIFKDWFVDFGPTRAKAESCIAYLDEQSWSLFSSHLNSSGLPDGWTTGPLRECAALNPESWTKPNFPEAIEYVDLSGVKWGVIASTERLLKADAPSRAQRVLRPGDTIVGTVRPGNGSFALVDREGLTGSTGFAALRPKRPAMREFVYLAATDAPNIERLAHLADGGAYPAVRPEVVLTTHVNLPPLPVMESFHSLVAPLVDMIQRNDAESAVLAAMRDTLLPKLMSGEVTVRDAEKSLEQSA
jgi:type I restriction enzyme S subunit